VTSFDILTIAPLFHSSNSEAGAWFLRSPECLLTRKWRERNAIDRQVELCNSYVDHALAHNMGKVEHDDQRVGNGKDVLKNGSARQFNNEYEYDVCSYEDGGRSLVPIEPFERGQ